MSVITNKHDDWVGAYHKKTCTLCGGQLHYPFVHWMTKTGSGEMFICSSCCTVNKDGLTADMVQVAAIIEIQKAGQDKYTLVRHYIPVLEKELAAQRKREEAEYGQRLRVVP